MDEKIEKEQDPRPDPRQLNAFERFYEHFRKVPLKYVDLFIGICITAFFVVVILGMLKDRGFF